MVAPILPQLTKSRIKARNGAVRHERVGVEELVKKGANKAHRAK